MLRSALLALTLILRVTAQDPTLPTKAQVNGALAALEGSGLEQGAQEEVRAALEKVLSDLQAVANNRQQAEELQAARAGAEQKLAQVQQRLAQLNEPAPPAPALPLEVDALESLQLQVQSELTAAKGAQQSARNSRDQRERRQNEIAQDLAAARGVTVEWSAPAVPTDASPTLAQALSWRGATERAVLDSRVRALDEEQLNLSNEALGAWRQGLVDATDAEVTRLEGRLTRVTQALEDRRRAAAEDQSQRAAQLAAQAQEGHPLVRRVSEQNATLSEENLEATVANQAYSERRSSLRSAHEHLSSELDELRARIEEFGLTDALGVLLRQQRTVARTALRRAQEQADVSEAYGANQLRLVELDERIRRLGGPTLPLRDRIERLELLTPKNWPDRTVPDAARSWQRETEQLTALLEDQRETLQTVRRTYEDRSRSLRGILNEADTLRLVASELRTFINENVLWIRSTTPIWDPHGEDTVAGLAWLVSPENWAGVVQRVVRDGQRYLPGYSLIALAMLGLAFGARWGRKRIRALGQEAARGATATYGITLQALLVTALVALTLPTLLWITGWRLQDLHRSESFGFAAGQGIRAVAWLALALGLLRQVLRRGGLADAHFRWPPAVVQTLRRDGTWALLAAMPLTWGLVTLEVFGNDPWRQSAGRALTLVLLLVYTATLWHLLHPRSGVLSHLNPDRVGAVGSSRRSWFALAIGVSFSLVVLCCLGFQFTVLQLSLRLSATLGFALALLVVNGLVLRALALARRDLAIRQAQERMAAAKEAKEAKQTGESAELLQEPTIDLGVVGQQMRRLLRGLLSILLVVGGYLLWVDMLPALGVLDEIGIYDENQDNVYEVTLASLLFAVVYVLVTLLAARNLTGLLQLVVLQRFNLQAGERHAITTIARYLVLAIGFSLAFGAVGIGWGKVQWLVAALGVGLGFGLQEIFANFVSGVIILLEQPIRVGDLVTVGGVNGFVTSIRIRSTVVTDYDKRELIIPNKEFITGQVINWSLSDPVTRVVIKVGIAYGSDTVLARKVLLDCARACPMALKEPKSKALFLGFGDSSLNLELRVFIAEMDDYPDLMNDLNTRIDAGFKEAGLEIPFPQRDVHVRNLPRGFAAPGGKPSGGEGDGAA